MAGHITTSSDMTIATYLLTSISFLIRQFFIYAIIASSSLLYINLVSIVFESNRAILIVLFIITYTFFLN